MVRALAGDSTITNVVPLESWRVERRREGMGQVGGSLRPTTED